MAGPNKTTTPFEVEDYRKDEILAALAAAGSPHIARTSKPDLVVAYGQLKRGHKSTAQKHLLAAGVKRQAKDTATTTPETAEKDSEGAYSRVGKVWVRRAGSTRGSYGKAVRIDGERMILTNFTSGDESTMAVADVEAAGPATLRTALEAAGGTPSSDGVPAPIEALEAEAA